MPECPHCVAGLHSPPPRPGPGRLRPEEASPPRHIPRGLTKLEQPLLSSTAKSMAEDGASAGTALPLGPAPAAGGTRQSL